MRGAITAGSMAVQPVIWAALGYQFEAASMVAGLAACLMSRLWVSLQGRSSTFWTWTVDLTITAITLLFTAGWIVLDRPAPFFALVSGTGFGAMGAGIIAMSLNWLDRIAPFADPSNRNVGPLKQDLHNQAKAKREEDHGAA